MARGSAKDLRLELDPMKIFSLGGYGTGKSVFASTFPTPGFVFDFDQRIKTYRGKDFDYCTVPMTGQGWVEYEKHHRDVCKEAKEGKLETVIIDSVTSMTDTAMERALMLDPKRSSEGGPIWNVHYQIVKNLMEPKLHAVLSLPCNVIIIGHWNIKTDQKTGNIISIDPMLTGQLSVKVPGYFDEVYAHFTGMKEGKERFYFRTVPMQMYKARSTVSGPNRLLPDEIDNNYEALMLHVRKAVENDKSAG